jgi:hypothetical protein
MLRVELDTIQPDYLRDYKGNESFGLVISDNNHPLQIYKAYSSIGSPIQWLRALKMGYGTNIAYTYEIDTDCISFSDGQYLIDSTKYFDNAVPVNILPDGIYFFRFYNGTEIFNSQCFKIVAQKLTGDYSQPEVKKFQNDELFFFSD